MTSIDFLVWRKCSAPCLKSLEDVGGGFSGVDYWEKNIPTFQAIDENWGAETVVASCSTCSWCHLTRIRRPPSMRRPQTWFRGCSREAAIQKVVHGKGLTEDLMLDVLWNLCLAGQAAAAHDLADVLKDGLAVHLPLPLEVCLELAKRSCGSPLQKGVVKQAAVVGTALPHVQEEIMPWNGISL
jgi:hypothetical protein